MPSEIRRRRAPFRGPRVERDSGAVALCTLVVQGTAPAMASSPAAAAVASSRFLPRTAFSTAGRRSGVAATPFTAMRMRAMVSPDMTVAAATFTSGKSHTFRSATFSK